jgi:rhamnosyltransferase
MNNIFIIGSKGIPARYGGFETFVDNLVSKKNSADIKYYVTCLSDKDDTFDYNGATCFNVKIPNVGSAKAVLYDLKSLDRCLKYIKDNKLADCCIYILACRIGPFIKSYKKRCDSLGVKLYVNPDGHEWKRSKWNAAVKKYWKISERLMVKNADLLICDSLEIERYIKEDYQMYSPKTTYIAYGADVEDDEHSKDAEGLTEWYDKFGIEKKQYYLIVGRFVPENNYELVIKEFMRSVSNKDLIIISNFERNDYYTYLLQSTGFNEDIRIKFVGTVYDQQLLKSIRANAFAYIHGHEVGGTNPSLLEAMAATKMNLLLDVPFNREVGRDGALYFRKTDGSLSYLINSVDDYEERLLADLGKRSKAVIVKHYSWDKIISEYEEIFLNL